MCVSRQQEWSKDPERDQQMTLTRSGSLCEAAQSGQISREKNSFTEKIQDHKHPADHVRQHSDSSAAGELGLHSKVYSLLIVRGSRSPSKGLHGLSLCSQLYCSLELLKSRVFFGKAERSKGTKFFLEKTTTFP